MRSIKCKKSLDFQAPLSLHQELPQSLLHFRFLFPTVGIIVKITHFFFTWQMREEIHCDSGVAFNHVLTDDQIVGNRRNPLVGPYRLIVCASFARTEYGILMAAKDGKDFANRLWTRCQRRFVSYRVRAVGSCMTFFAGGLSHRLKNRQR